MKKFTFLCLSALLTMILFTVSSCSKDDSVSASAPTLKVEGGEVTESSVSFTVTAENATKVCYSYIREGETAPTLASVLKDGKLINNWKNPVTIEDLVPNTAYAIYVAAEGNGGSLIAQPLILTTSRTRLTAAAIDNYYSPNEYVLNLGNDNYMVTLDFYSTYTGDGALWLMPGTYTVKGTEKGEIDGAYSMVTFSNETEKSVKSGTVKVALSDNDAYSLELDLVLGDGQSIAAVYEGEIPRMKNYSINLSALNVYEVDDKTDGLFVLKGNDADWNFEVTFWFYAAAGSKELPAGTYTLGDSKTAGTLGVLSNINAYDDERFTRYFEADTYSGTVVVAKDGSDYTFTINLTGTNGYKYTGSYTGKVGGMNK